VPEADNQAESGQGDDHPRRGVGQAWWLSLWFWPAVAIALVGAAGTLFGSIGALLAAEAAAGLLVATAVLFLSRDRWLTFGLAGALTAFVILLAASIWLSESRSNDHHVASPPVVSVALSSPVRWPWRQITQAMADQGNFRGADLVGANLNGLELSYKDLDGAQADGASFRGAQLQHASLRGASLRGACLAGANLTGADLTGADFTGADVTGVIVSVKAEQAALAWPSTRDGASSPACSA
jgi:hypothetical protein